MRLSPLRRSTRPAPSGSRSRSPTGASSAAVPTGAARRLARTAAWNVIAGVEVLRRVAEDGTPPMTVRLVTLGRRGGRAARSGRSRLDRPRGSDARPGRAPSAHRGPRRDRLSPTPSPSSGVDLDRAIWPSKRQLENAAAYLELHIEQGTGAFEAMVLALGCRLCATRTFRRRAPPDHLTGQVAHAGRNARWTAARDPSPEPPSSRFDIRRIAAEIRRGAVARAAEWSAAGDRHPVVRNRAEQLLDRATRRREASRHSSPRRRRRRSDSLRRRTSEVAWERIWSIEPILARRPASRDLSDEAIRECGARLTGSRAGPLHDAAEAHRRGRASSTQMLFVQSLRGLSHTKLERYEARAPGGSGGPRDRLADKQARVALLSSTGRTIDLPLWEGAELAALGEAGRLRRPPRARSGLRRRPFDVAIRAGRAASVLATDPTRAPSAALAVHDLRATRARAVLCRGRRTSMCPDRASTRRSSSWSL